MSKILKVKMKAIKSGGGTHLVYPKEYDAKKIQVLAYGGGETVDGNRYGYCIGVVKDIDAPSFLQSQDIVEIDRAEAVNLGSQWKPQITKISDENKVLSICKKVFEDEALTSEDRDALDPKSSVKGITESQSFDTLLDRYCNAL